MRRFGEFGLLLVVPWWVQPVLFMPAGLTGLFRESAAWWLRVVGGAIPAGGALAAWARFVATRL